MTFVHATIGEKKANVAAFGHGIGARIQSEDPGSERWNRQNVRRAYNGARRVGNVAPVLVGTGIGGLGATPPNEDAEDLMEAWTPDPVSGQTMDNIPYHFGKHGEEVRAESGRQYLRKAKAFRQ